MNKYKDILALTILGLIFIGLKCSNDKYKSNSSVGSVDISNVPGIKRFGIDPTVTIKPRNLNGNNGRLRELEQGLPSGEQGAGGSNPYSGISKTDAGNDLSVRSTGTRTYNGSIDASQFRFNVPDSGGTNLSWGDSRINPFCSRRSCTWDEDNGSLSYKRYNFSFAPGIEIFGPKGVGIDARFFRIGDFAAQGGAAYLFTKKEVQPSIGLSYNLRRTKILSNCDLFVSYTPATWIGGFRIELGEY